MKRPVCFLILLLCSCTVQPFVLAQDTARAERHSKRVQWIPLPFAGYSPETHLFGGAVLLTAFRWGRDTTVPASLTELNFTYTERQQLITEAKWYLRAGNRYVIKGFASFARFPDKYWGTGPDASPDPPEHYNSNRYRLTLEVMRQWRTSFFAGISYRFVNIQDIMHQKGPELLATTQVTGYRGNRTALLGPLLLFDNRDHVYGPAKGGYYSLQCLWGEPWWGGDYRFMRYEMDLRKYIRTLRRQVLALQVKTALTDGDTPFSVMPQIGSDEDMRGYYRGRYRDMTYYSMQAEYRFPVWKRLGMAVFGGMGNVGPQLEALYRDDPKFSYGAGLRFTLSEKHHIKLRLDVAMGMGNHGFYALVGEAF